MSLLKCWPQVPKSSAALGFGLELLNSGERFRAIMALLLYKWRFQLFLCNQSVLMMTSHTFCGW